METIKAIQKQQQMIARLEQEYAVRRIKERKKETRHKIELGGLVVKSKMDEYSKAVILGALIDALENLKRDESAKSLFHSKGEAAFMGYD